MQTPTTALYHLQTILHKPGSFTIIENTLGTLEEGERLRAKLRADLKEMPKPTQKFFENVLRGWTCETFHLILINTRED